MTRNIRIFIKTQENLHLKKYHILKILWGPLPPPVGTALNPFTYCEKTVESVNR